MTTGAQPPSAEVDAFFTDSFDLGASLSELYENEIHRLEQQAGEDPSSPIPIYAMRGGKAYIVEQGIWIRPDTFHQAYDLGGDTEEVVETATAHYAQLREFGMKVVGHLFEPVEEDFEGFQTHPKYPTILVGGKSRIEKEPINPMQLTAGEDSRARYREAADRAHGRTLSQEAIEELGVTQEDLENAILSPLREYYAWCKAKGEAYVLSSLDVHSIHNYIRHPLGYIGLTEVSTTMGSVELGNLRSSEQNFKHFAKTLLAAA